MDFVQNFPFFSIILCMISAIISPVLSGKNAKRLCRASLVLVAAMSLILLAYLLGKGESYVYLMGHYPAPWGNEIRAGALEALMALFFSVIALLSITGGMESIFTDIEPSKINLYFVLVNLIMSSLLAMVYTNDLFTAYVFIEINTIAGCGLIMIRRIGKTTVTAARYMVVSLLGSGLFLIGVTLTYTITGHLLMPNIQTAVQSSIQNEDYHIVLIIVIGLMTVGLALKSGLYPFHVWIPDAYGYSNVASSALLSGIVSKGYIFLLIKIYYRVIGFDIVKDSQVFNIVFVFGIAGIIMGSVMATREKSLRKIIAYSSVAQIGYIYMGIGLGTTSGTVAAIFHIFSHGATKALLFIASAEFTEGSHTKKLDQIVGQGRKYRLSALTFSIGALSMVGFPMLSGFISKIMFSTAAMQNQHKMYFAVFALALSTILNAIYFLRIVIYLYSERSNTEAAETEDRTRGQAAVGKRNHTRILHYAAIIALVMINFALGMFSQPIINVIERGLSMFS